MLGQFRSAAELDAARLGAFAAFTGAGADQLAPFSAAQPSRWERLYSDDGFDAVPILARNLSKGYRYPPVDPQLLKANDHTQGFRERDRPPRCKITAVPKE